MNDLLGQLQRMFRRRGDNALVIGVTGGVAVGKTTFAERLADDLRSWSVRPAVEIVSTDGFLHTNKVLAERGLSYRKGFPESYDVDALSNAIRALRTRRPARVPNYSHITYDVDAQNARTIEKGDVIIFDGLHLGRVKHSPQGERLLDTLIYLDADETDIERWFADRLIALMLAGQRDASSFYYQFRDMDEAARRAFVSRVWQGINLPNLRDHILKDRDVADVIVRKRADHSLAGITLR